MYFECSSGTGKGNNLIVTCASDFAGVTISCTNGVKTYSKVCPSSEPYEIEFSGLESGTWTISGTLEGSLYSTNVVIADYTATLESGFDYKAWCTEGGVDATQYSSLADVFDDELAVHRLMTVHASCDYLIEAVSDDINTIDDFCANDTAMKWIGLRDYVCDGLTAINGVEAKFLASQYWERYLKDHVPTMTSNTAPYGVASATSEYSSFSAYKAFDGNDSTMWLANAKTNSRIVFKFANPINVKQFEVKSNYNSSLNAASIKNYKIQYSDDGTNFTDVDNTSFIYPNQNGYLDKHEVDDSGYHMCWAMYISDTYNTSSTSIAIETLQFYGRSLNVSVPVMTSNTTPFGVASASNEYNSNQAAWKAFDGIANTEWHTVANGIPAWLEYDFTSNVAVKMAIITNRVNSSGEVNSPKNFSIEGSDGVTWDSIGEYFNNDNTRGHITVCNATKVASYKKWRMNVTSSNGGYEYACVSSLQFYGVDYSEREFEPNTNKKWLYDHGLELEAITTSGTVTKGSNYLTLSAANSEATATVDLTNYSILRGKVGDHMSGTTQLSVGGSNPATATLTSANAPNNFSLGTSLFDQSLATGVKMTANGVCDITELWLEQ